MGTRTEWRILHEKFLFHHVGKHGTRLSRSASPHMKIKNFMWLLAWERLVTKNYRSKWKQMEDMRCCLCDMERETVQHLFVQCEISSKVWDGMLPLFNAEVSIGTNLKEMWCDMQDITEGKMSKVKQ